MFKVLDLFSGIGGFSLGLERTGGFETVAFCEVDDYAVKVLNKHWPDVPVYGDIRELTGERLRADGITPNVLCGGFPCQDISYAGLGAGITGERSGLWAEYARLISDLRPRYAIVENVAALLSRGLDRVLGDLAAIGYDAEWHCIPASAVGAPHRRDRVWIITYPSPARTDATERGPQKQRDEPHRDVPCDGTLPDASGAGLADQWHEQGTTRNAATGHLAGLLQTPSRQWEFEPDVGRVAHGVPCRVDRIRCLGNAVVPQIPELLGRAILAAEHEHQPA